MSQKPYILLLCFFIFMWPLICQTAVQPWLKVLSEVGLHRKFTIRTFPHSSPNFYMGMKNPEYSLNFRPQSPLCHSRFKLEQHVWNLEHSWSTDDLPTVHTWYSLAYTPLRKWGYEIPRPPLKNGLRQSFESSVTRLCNAKLCWHLVGWCIMRLMIKAESGRVVRSGCLTLLEIFWKFAKSPGNFLAEFVCLLLLWLAILVFQNVSVETSGFMFNCNCNC